jgi:hypothetical protein
MPVTQEGISSEQLEVILHAMLRSVRSYETIDLRGQKQRLTSAIVNSYDVHCYDVQS